MEREKQSQNRVERVVSAICRFLVVEKGGERKRGERLKTNNASTFGLKNDPEPKNKGNRQLKILRPPFPIYLFVPARRTKFRAPMHFSHLNSNLYLVYTVDQIYISSRTISSPRCVLVVHAISTIFFPLFLFYLVLRLPDARIRLYSIFLLCCKHTCLFIRRCYVERNAIFRDKRVGHALLY